MQDLLWKVRLWMIMMHLQFLWTKSMTNSYSHGGLDEGKTNTQRNKAGRLCRVTYRLGTSQNGAISPQTDKQPPQRQLLLPFTSIPNQNSSRGDSLVSNMLLNRVLEKRDLVSKWNWNLPLGPEEIDGNILASWLLTGKNRNCCKQLQHFMWGSNDQRQGKIIWESSQSRKSHFMGMGMRLGSGRGERCREGPECQISQAPFLGGFMKHLFGFVVVCLFLCFLV